MIRTLVAAVLCFAVLVQTACPLVCQGILALQNQKEHPASCCSQKALQKTEEGKPLRAPAGMPEESCCLKRGPLLAKALVPDTHSIEPPVVAAVLPELPLLAIFTLVEAAPETHSISWRPPPSQAALQVFRI